MTAVMQAGPVPATAGAGSGDSSGISYPGPRRPLGVDQAAGAALDLVVPASSRSC